MAHASASPLEETDRVRLGSLGTIGHLLVLAWAAAIASFPLDDNSFFTHLATGRIILDTGSVPSRDPYTFTALGDPWTVQSWLVSVALAAGEAVAGAAGLRAVVLALFLGSATVLWRLTSSASSFVLRVCLASAAMVAATNLWTPRPYMVGVIGLGLVVLALEGRVRPWILAPIGWVWANSHGSFPLGLALIGLVAAGTWLDSRGLDGSGDGPAPGSSPARGRDPGWGVERSVASWFGAGVLVGVVGPLGLRALTFPVSAFSRAGSLSLIAEWNPPRFESPGEMAFLGIALLSILALTRLASWRHALPLAVFLCAGFYAQRNIVMAVVVAVPVLAAAAPSVGTLRSSARPSLAPVAAAVVGGVLVVVAGAALARPATTLDGYAARPLAWSSTFPAPDGAVVTDEVTGNLLEVLDGPTGTVYVDDRADMFPTAVFADLASFYEGRPGWEERLDRLGAARVIWARDAPLSALLAESDRWQVVYADTGWVVADRRD